MFQRYLRLFPYTQIRAATHARIFPRILLLPESTCVSVLVARKRVQKRVSRHRKISFLKVVYLDKWIFDIGKIMILRPRDVDSQFSSRLDHLEFV